MTVNVADKELSVVSLGATVKMYSKVPTDDESIVHCAFLLLIGQFINEPTFTEDCVC